MSLWRSIRGEMAGAWRSIRYDLGHRPGRDTGAVPDVTSTGMNTFGASLVDLPGEPPEIDARPPRRFVAITAFCALAACGAAGSYLVATTAFAGRMTDAPPPAVAAPPPPAAETEAGTGGEAGMGGVPAAPRKPRTTTPPATVRPPSPTPAAIPATKVATSRNARPAAVPVSRSPECDCETPPVPTPTVPSSSVPVSASPSAEVSPSPAEPSASLTDSDGHHHRRWR
jgi:hypothetical protein